MLEGFILVLSYWIYFPRKFFGYKYQQHTSGVFSNIQFESITFPIFVNDISLVTGSENLIFDRFKNIFRTMWACNMTWTIEMWCGDNGFKLKVSLLSIKIYFFNMTGYGKYFLILFSNKSLMAWSYAPCVEMLYELITKLKYLNCARRKYF